ncbi:DUF2786 domain-containing protein [Rhodococcus sp. NPDC049939]|uniref:DUF2786 domain-containing protein n=1 Tax=Rhodococcus sp. NPDC049939 TaxID=3155511 RepID=UPI0033E955A3
MFDDEADLRPASTVHILVGELSSAYERGWQPADIVHLARRSREPSDAPLAATLVLYESRRTRAEHRAPRDWVDQLRTIGEQYPAANRLARRCPAEEADFRTLAAGLMYEDPFHPVQQFTDLSLTWTNLPGWTMLTPPPSTWPSVRIVDGVAESATRVDTKVLNRIRGLLAKAEATDFAEEAEIFTSKAQELMTRYAITATLLHKGSGMGDTPVHSRRIHLENPYLKEKVHLLTEIGDANQVRTVWFSSLAIATVVGTPLALQQVDLLFTSLLVQATHAMQLEDADSRGGSHTTSFRKGFLAGFASRIGQRLRDADSRAMADAADEASIRVQDLLPILARRSEAVDSEFERLFPNTRKSRRKAVDVNGWYAGQSAADAASLAPGERALRR